jgi:hypothetical protein
MYDASAGASQAGVIGAGAGGYYVGCVPVGSWRAVSTCLGLCLGVGVPGAGEWRYARTC